MISSSGTGSPLLGSCWALEGCKAGAADQSKGSRGLPVSRLPCGNPKLAVSVSPDVPRPCAFTAQQMGGLEVTNGSYAMHQAMETLVIKQTKLY